MIFTKKLISISLAAAAMFAFSSCSSSMSYDDYDLKDYIKVGEYKGLQVAPYTVSVTEDEIDSRIQSNLETASSERDLKSGEVIADGDTVNIDYEGKVDEKVLDNASDEDYDLVIGSGSFIDGFESGLIGEKVGEKVVLDLTFPDDYSEEDLQGKDAEFTVKINSAKRTEVPEYNLEFVQENTDYETLDEYEKSVEDQLYSEKETEAVNNQKTELWSQALDNTEVKEYPQRELDHYIEANSEQIDSVADDNDMTREEVLSMYEFGDEDEFAAVNEDSSKLRVKQEMLIEYIADKEDLSYTEEEKNQLIQIYESQGYDNDAIVEQTGRTMGDYVHIELLYSKVLDFLLENAEITGAAVSE